MKRIIQYRSYDSDVTIVFDSWNEEFISKFKRLMTLNHWYEISFDIIGDVQEKGEWFTVVSYDDFFEDFANDCENTEENKNIIEWLKRY